LTVTRGKRHDYLGMTIDFSDPGNVTFTMIDYIHKMLEGLPEYMTGETVSPAAHHLFAINEDDPVLLCEKDAIMFHHNTAKLLFLYPNALIRTYNSLLHSYAHKYRIPKQTTTRN